MTELELQKAVQKIAFTVTHGDLNQVDLTCPKCGYFPLIYSYALNRPGRFGLYIHCQNCGLLHHFWLGSKPPNFREDLILPYYQELENQAVQFADSLGDSDTKKDI